MTAAKPKLAFFAPRRAWLALACALLAASAGAAEPDVVKATGHPNWPPFSWQSGDHIVGVGAELADIIFGELGFKVVATASGNWKRAQTQVEHGAADIIVAIYLTDERKKYLAYPATPFMDDANVVWVAKGRPFPFHKWDDLIGKAGIAMRGESYGEQFDRFINEKLQFTWVSTPGQCLKMLELGRADYYPFSLYGGQIQAHQFGLDGKVEALPQVISTEGTYIGISKQSKFIKYLPQVQAAIERLRADGTVERLVKKHVALAAREAPSQP